MFLRSVCSSFCQNFEFVFVLLHDEDECSLEEGEPYLTLAAGTTG